MTEQKKLKKLTSGNVFKFEKAGDSVSGKLVGYEESKMFPNSYAVKIKNPANNDNTIVFVSEIVISKLKDANIQPGQDVMIEFLGMVKSEKSGMEYKNYDVYA
jgi:hypothetical protein